MDKKLYHYMNWREIEGIVYSENDNPHEWLGPHMVKDGLLIQTFLPGAEEIKVRLEGVKKLYPMELVDEAGYFAVLIPNKKHTDYRLVVNFGEDNIVEYDDPYAYHPVIPEAQLKKFNAGINYEIYDYLGAHVMERGGVKGVLFAVWAPYAMRVSVVGDFNLWDGRRHPMRRLGESGVFELFIPGIKEGELYKYEVKKQGGLTVLKADPYAFQGELRPNNASVVRDISNFSWSDEAWMEKRKEGVNEKPMSIYEVHLGSWKKPEEDRDAFYNYRELAPMLADYVHHMEYTHIELMPVMEHPLDASWGYQVTGYYAPSSRYGTPQDFMYFMNYMHEQGIGVILDWVPAHFPKDLFGLSEFDGTCLYEHKDPRQGTHPHWGTLIYNYGRKEVINFLIGSALFWVEKYHADGIRMDAVASMLYLDYGKQDGEWIANIYGGKENLEAISFLQQLNQVIQKKKNGVLLIAEESTAWPMVTGPVKKDGLGFDYKWNMGWMNDFLRYMQTDPYFRHEHYGELTFSMVYAYSENFILVLSHDEVVHGKASLIYKMPGEDLEKKFANLRAAYGFFMTHPGKKLLFMGQDFAQTREWSEERSLDWDLLEQKEHARMQEYVKALNHLYQTEPSLYELDLEPEGFEWINNISSDESILVYVRKAKKKADFLVVVCNFDTIARENYKIGVPKAGKYKEIFNSDRVEFGGSGHINPRVKNSVREECDDREHSIKIKVPALGMSVLRYMPSEQPTVAKRRKG